jgi:endo-1,4-beta-xylanase
MKNLSFYVFLLSFTILCACNKKKSDGPAIGPVQPTNTTLKDSAPFPWGMAIDVNRLKTNELYNGVVTKESSSITAENAMKFGNTHPSKNTYRFTDADYLVDYAISKGKRIHGHCLIWNNSNPTWLTSFVGTKDEWEAIFKEHIQTVVSHFKGKVKSWDVVNEAINDQGVLSTGGFWYKNIGPDYVDKAFQYAHEADPDALLFYNDYGNEYSATRCDGIVNFVKDLKKRGIPIDGIGLQMHTSAFTKETRLAYAITTAASTGLKVHISELDVALNTDANPNPAYTPALATLPAAQSKFIVKTYKSIPAAQQFGITTWDVSDADSWIPISYNRPDWPLPFDSNYEKKAAYQGILDGLK